MSGSEHILDDARSAFDRNDWPAARAALLEADAQHPLEAEDLERLAWSCRWAGDQSGFVNALERAEVAFVDAGGLAGAARMALEQARHHAQMLDDSVALTCFVRAAGAPRGAARVAPSTRRPCGRSSFTQMEAGDVEAARASLHEARAIARRVGSPGMEAMAVQGLAHLAVTEGERERGAPAPRRGGRAGHAARGRADPRRLRVLRGDLDLSGALRLGPGHRVDEGVDPLLRARVDRRVHGAVPLPPGRDRPAPRSAGRGRGAGRCRRARSCERSTATAPAGGTASWSRSGCVAATWPAPRRRSRRPSPSATTASRGGVACCWRKAMPGRRCGASPARSQDPGFLARERRVFVLPVHVAACLAVGDEQAAPRASPSSRSWLDGWAPRARRPPRPWHAAQLALHRGDTEAAIASLQEGVRTWCEVDAPYEAAQARVLLARALAADGDDAGARLEIKAAARMATEIGVAVDLDIAPARPEPALRTRPHLPVLRHRRLDATGRGDGRRRLGAAAALARPHLARRVRAVARRRGQARRRRVLRRPSAKPTTASPALPRSSAPSLAIEPSTASRRPSASGCTSAKPPARDDDYFGSAVTRAARISAAAGRRRGPRQCGPASPPANGRSPVAGERTLELKGIAEPVVAVLIAWDDETQIQPSEA